MEIYRLNNIHVPTHIIDEFESCVWTERYTDAGDFKLVLPATRFNISILSLGTKLRNNKSAEKMIIETREMADGMMTISGRSLETLLNNSGFPIRIPGGSLTLTGTPGGIITRLAQEAIYHAKTDPDTYNSPYLRLGPQDNAIITGFPVTEVISQGSLYSQILAVAQKYGVGLSMYATPIDKVDYNLFFKTYRGEDRTSRQTTFERVRFSPKLDNFQGVKELYSKVDSLDEVVVYPPAELRALFNTTYGPDRKMIRVLSPGLAKSREPYDYTLDHYDWTIRRKSIVADGVTQSMIGTRGDGFPSLARLMRQVGELELKKHEKTVTIDGEVIPKDDLVYRKDYHLGDQVEIEGEWWPNGHILGVITEYINIADGSGERAYPAITPPISLPFGDPFQASATMWNDEAF